MLVDIQGTENVIKFIEASKLSKFSILRAGNTGYNIPIFECLNSNDNNRAVAEFSKIAEILSPNIAYKINSIVLPWIKLRLCRKSYFKESCNSLILLVSNCDRSTSQKSLNTIEIIKRLSLLTFSPSLSKQIWRFRAAPSCLKFRHIQSFKICTHYDPQISKNINKLLQILGGIIHFGWYNNAFWNNRFNFRIKNLYFWYLNESNLRYLEWFYGAKTSGLTLVWAPNKKVKRSTSS